ncbi:MAG: efflux RND transporter periplasmic adaptor subunit, partial [Thermoguttaceae bacterium]|nr:efflux RND transporter periplasmic adaptor subunit [Thermoguttaceae bacterium]
MRDLTTKGFYRLLSMLAPLFALALSGCYEKPNTAEAKRPPVPVVLATAEKQDIRITVRLTGKTNTDPVKIVPRVRGYIESINFKPGDIVKEGDILYEIEKFDYQNKLDVAIASRDRCVADVENTKADYDRDLALQQQGQGFTTQADIDRDKALFDEAKANLASAEADIEMAKKELERCTIKATVTGLISRTKIAEGNMVDGTSGTETVLTDIAPMDPMYVYFQITDSVFNNFMASLR